jgi:formiminotetrahydrofolate cyclodeaminase
LVRASGTVFATQTIEEFSRALASAEPIPGGGSAAAVVAALGASLAGMVARLSADRPRYEPYQATHARALTIADAARARLLALADADAASYAGLTAARRLPRETAEQTERRRAAVREAAQHAVEVPRQVVDECRTLILTVDDLAGRSNLNAASDLVVAALLLDAAARGAGENVLVNLPALGDEHEAAGLTVELEGHLHEIDSAAARIHRQVRSGGLRAPEAP